MKTSYCFAISTLLTGLSIPMATLADNLSQAPSAASQTSIEGSALIIQGSIDVIATSRDVVIKSIQTVGDAIVLVLQGASEVGTVTLQLSGNTAGYASLAVGTTLEVVTESTGYLLTQAGKTVAFIPNQVGRSMIYHSEHPGSPTGKALQDSGQGQGPQSLEGRGNQ
ncbi:MAG: hypothetical protein U1F76_11850 [Candidatus Competibacteraceae bacterium]